MGTSHTFDTTDSEIMVSLGKLATIESGIAEVAPGHEQQVPEGPDSTIVDTVSIVREMGMSSVAADDLLGMLSHINISERVRSRTELLCAVREARGLTEGPDELDSSRERFDHEDLVRLLPQIDGPVGIPGVIWIFPRLGFTQTELEWAWGPSWLTVLEFGRLLSTASEAALTRCADEYIKVRIPLDDERQAAHEGRYAAEQTAERHNQTDDAVQFGYDAARLGAGPRMDRSWDEWEDGNPYKHLDSAVNDAVCGFASMDLITVDGPYTQTHFDRLTFHAAEAGLFPRPEPDIE